MQEQSLKDKTVKGVGWSAIDGVLGKGVTFVVGIVLARLLSPDEYGLIGLVTIFTTILGGIVDSGFSNALIRKTDCSERDYSTMFITNLAFSVVLYLLLFFSAGFIASFFGRKILVELLQVTGLILIINALSLVQYTRLAKILDFKTKTKASFISSVASGVVGVAMALSGCGVWSLVGQTLSSRVLYTMCLWGYNRWKPSMTFDLNSFHYMWGYGWKLLVSNLLNNIWNQLYQTVVGKFYTPATLGQYTKGKEIADLFSSSITSVVQKVSFPALSCIQDETQRMVAAYRRIIKLTMFVTVIILFSLGAAAEPLLFCLFGPQWGEAASYLPLICVSMSFYPLHAINLNMLQVQGRSDIFLVVEIVKKVVAIGPICVGVFVNIYWMLVASIVAGVISFFLNTWYTGRTLGYSSWMQLKDVSPYYGVAMIMAAFIYFLKFLPISFWVVLPMQVVVGSIVFFIICHFTKLNEYKEVKCLVLEYLHRMRCGF